MYIYIYMYTHTYIYIYIYISKQTDIDIDTIKSIDTCIEVRPYSHLELKIPPGAHRRARSRSICFQTLGVHVPK